MPQRLMHHDVDPSTQIWDAIGDISKFEVMHNDVLIAVYIRPRKMKGITTRTGELVNLELPDQTIREDENQGKAGLVLKKGPLAFVSDENYDFKGQDVKPGDWVAIWVYDGRKIIVNSVLCRMVEDRHIRLKIPAPDMVF